MSKKMSKENNSETDPEVTAEAAAASEDVSQAEPETETPLEEAAETAPLQETLEKARLALVAKEEQYLRLAAEYDNFRKRTLKEKEAAWAESKMETVKAFLPVYDNLARALKQETCDEAYAKGVEMTMTGLKNILEKLGVTEIPAMGCTFDPNLHNAVMHTEDESVGENTIVDVFEPGFMLGEKVIRFALVKVAN